MMIGNNPLDMGHFDHVPAALLIMFELGTQENWPTMMYAAIDARENLPWLVGWQRYLASPSFDSYNVMNVI
jgi:hypothetical protein